MSRRGLLQLGILAGMLGVAGCGEEGTKTITTPPGESGVRKRLELFKEKAEEAQAKQKQKKKK